MVRLGGVRAPQARADVGRPAAARGARARHGGRPPPPPRAPPGPRCSCSTRPLSALDLKLRQEMRSELKRLQRETGITFIFVTHDQEEALSMSDRIAVMSAGEVAADRPPVGDLRTPGEPLRRRFHRRDEPDRRHGGGGGGHTVTCRLPDGETVHALANRATSTGQSGTLSIRPERLTITRDPPAGESLRGRSRRLHLPRHGHALRGAAERTAFSLTARMQNIEDAHLRLDEGDPVHVSIADGAARFLVRTDGRGHRQRAARSPRTFSPVRGWAPAAVLGDHRLFHGDPGAADAGLFPS